MGDGEIKKHIVLFSACPLIGRIILVLISGTIYVSIKIPRKKKHKNT